MKEQAQQLGWAKATKLEGRQAVQGLVAVTTNKNNGALVELNCETDFVARNEVFQKMAEVAAIAVLNYAEKQQHSNEPVRKVNFFYNCNSYNVFLTRPIEPLIALYVLLLTSIYLGPSSFHSLSLFLCEIFFVN